MSHHQAAWRGFRPEPDVLHKVSPRSIWCYKKPGACGNDLVDYVAVCITCESMSSYRVPPLTAAAHCRCSLPPLTAAAHCRRSLPLLTAASLHPLLPASVHSSKATTIPSIVLNGFIDPSEVSVGVVLGPGEALGAARRVGGPEVCLCILSNMCRMRNAGPSLSIATPDSLPATCSATARKTPSVGKSVLRAVCVGVCTLGVRAPEMRVNRLGVMCVSCSSTERPGQLQRGDRLLAGAGATCPKPWHHRGPCVCPQLDRSERV